MDLPQSSSVDLKIIVGYIQKGERPLKLSTLGMQRGGSMGPDDTKCRVFPIKEMMSKLSIPEVNSRGSKKTLVSGWHTSWNIHA